jgi:hypothetical protein
VSANEFKTVYLGRKTTGRFRKTTRAKDAPIHYYDSHTHDESLIVNSAVDWVAEGAVTAVKDQGHW